MKVTILKNEIPRYEFIVPTDELLVGSEFFIGRSDDCHIVLDDQKISRYHAKIEVGSDGIYISKDSEFGELLLNGKKISNSVIREADRLTIDDYVLIFSDMSTQNIQTFIAMPIASKQATDELPNDLYSLEDELEAIPNENPTEILSADDQELLEEMGDEYIEDKEFETSDEPADFEEDTQANFVSNDGEDDFGSEGFGEEDADDGFGFDDDSAGTQVFQSFATYYLKLEGKYAPVDRFQVGNDPIIIGRDPEKCQIYLADGEVSGIHAIIKKNFISCTIEDQKSSNGTKLNGERINKAELVNGDVIEIGSTKILVEIISDLIEAEKDMLMPVEKKQVVEVEEIVEEEVEFDELSGQAEEIEKSLFKRIMKDPKKKRVAIFAIVGIMLAMLLGDEEQPQQDNIKVKAAEIKAKAEEKKKKEEAKKEYDSETKEKLEQNYQLALAKYEVNEFKEARTYLDIVRSIDPEYENTSTLYKLINQALEEITRLEKEEQEEKERKLRMLEVQKLVEKARSAVKEREVPLAEGLFGQILEKDPENIDVPQMRLEIDAYKKQLEEKRLAEEAEKVKRNKMIEQLNPGKTLYLREDWYNAITKLEEFAGRKGIDEDLMTEGTDMLREARQRLNDLIEPLIGQARSYKEGQDLKRAYETYGKILGYNPGHEEALNEREEIKFTLQTRSRKIYREALISESLSLFEEAKEKYQEVQQVSPIGSEYYRKATDKLRDYLE